MTQHLIASPQVRALSEERLGQASLRRLADSWHQIDEQALAIPASALHALAVSQGLEGVTEVFLLSFVG